MDLKAIPTRIVETRMTKGDPVHCSWEVQLFDNISNTVQEVIIVDLNLSGVGASKSTYNTHLKQKTVERAMELGYLITNSDVIIF